MSEEKQELVRFAGYDCVVRIDRYASGGNTALSLYDAKSGDPVATATINFPDIPLLRDQVFIKDYSENEGMLAALEEAGIVRKMGVYVPTGIGSLPVCQLLIRPPEQEKVSINPLPKSTLSDWRQELAKDMLAEAETKTKSKPRDIEKDRE